MAHRKLNDNVTEFHEFSNQNLSKALKQAGKFAEKKELDFASLFMQHHWNEEDGHVLYLFVAK